MFTGVCLSTGGVPGPGGVSGPGGAWFCTFCAWWRPPRRLLLRAVRILLECILVHMFIKMFIGNAGNPESTNYVASRRSPDTNISWLTCQIN